MDIITPKDYFGFTPGDEGEMFNWQQLMGYYETVAKKSDKIKIEYPGKTLDGNEFAVLIISSADNLKNLNRYKNISMKLAYPESMSEESCYALAREGKAICVCSYSLHAHEIGGTQSTPLIVYDLLTSNDESVLNILDNVIFIMFPCANPDGLNINAEWNYSVRGTSYDGGTCIREYNKYASHGNNRDALFFDLYETKYITDYLFRNWHATTFMDFHHQPMNYDRISVEPLNDPVREELNPLLLRELQFIGNGIACSMEEHDVPNVVTQGEEFNYSTYFTYQDAARYHNIIGMLVEVAHTPGTHSSYYKKGETGLKGDMPSLTNPHPWDGGRWSLADIVHYDYLATMGLLKLTATNREELLKNVGKKAIRQIKRGEKSEEKAYIIPAVQHDQYAAKHLLEVLKLNNIKVYKALSDFVVSGKQYAKDDFIVPFNQPDYAVASILLKKRIVPDDIYNKNYKGEYIVGDIAASNISEWMGVDAIPACEELSVSSELCYDYEVDELSSNNNISYKIINQYFDAGLNVYENNGRFNTDGSGKQLKKLKIAYFMIDLLGYDSAAFCNHTLDKFAFKHTLVDGAGIRNGVLNDFDVLILPGYNSETLLREDAFDEKVASVNRVALGADGLCKIKEFVNNGGRVVAWGKTAHYLNSGFGLGIKIIGESKAKTYFTGGSSLKTNITDDMILHGMKKEVTIMSADSLMFECNSDNYKSLMKYKDNGILSSGILVNEDIIAGRSCAFKFVVGKGDIICFGFDPQFRSQTDGTFKLLSNTLYRW